ncbi:hypothetical protein [Klebsiella quasipneumoniae]|uniref:hypothetical protein n=1 Tax=Klebsiella quasipneumoniae TaxID=1463165 RepID=UPI00132B5D1D|nr:hypothetical protein [Klebsiella quasipneumoniae]MRE26236.1 hypothetical protein [Klebsiella quasipneumoniae]MRE52996.1 hypothetical protein [Klebsiella quasipneumoniae]
MDMKEPTEQELRDFLLRKYLEEKIDLEHEANAAHFNGIMQRNKQKLMEVDAATFFKFLSAKGVERKCAACGSEKLTVPETTDLKAKDMPENYEQLPPLEQGFLLGFKGTTYVHYVSFDENNPFVIDKSYYTVHCQNCGNLTLYRTKAVLEWLSSLQDKSGETNA